MEEEKIELVETDETTFGITAEELETIKEIVSSGIMSAEKAAKVFGLPIEKIKEICSE